MVPLSVVVLYTAVHWSHCGVVAIQLVDFEELSRRNGRDFVQVPSERVRWRHILLLEWHDAIGSCYSRALRQDDDAVLCAANPQLPLLDAADLQADSLSEAQTSQVRTLSLRLL